MQMPKSVETRKHSHAAKQGMIACDHKHIRESVAIDSQCRESGDMPISSIQPTPRNSRMLQLYMSLFRCISTSTNGYMPNSTLKIHVYKIKNNYFLILSDPVEPFLNLPNWL